MPHKGYSSTPKPPSAKNIFGTTSGQYDIFYGAVWGTRTAFKIGLFVVCIAALVGVSVGVISGYYGGLLDEILMRIVDIVFAIPLLVLTMHEEQQYAVRVIEAGAMGYITKKSAPEQLVTAIRKVHDGTRFLTEEAAEYLALYVAKGRTGKSPLDLLSARELQVLRRLALGHTNREIAEAYNISIKTVFEKYLESIFSPS